MIYGMEHGAAALLVIDVQREYFRPDGPAYVPSSRTILGPINALIGAFKAAELPVIYVTHMNRGDGSDAGRMGDFSDPDEADSFVEGTAYVELVPELAHDPARDIVIVKRRYSAFAGTDLQAVLRTAGTRTIVICGLMTSFCCETTARDGHGRDYEVIFVTDANEGPDLMAPDGSPVDHADVLRSTITALSAGFAETVDSAEVIARISAL